MEIVALWADPSWWLAVRLSICENNDSVRYVAPVTSRWSQHHRTNVGERISRVGAASWVSKWRNGWLDCSDWRVSAQVKAASNARRKSDDPDACATAVNIQSSDQLWQKRLHLGEILRTDTSRLIHYEDDVWRTVHWWNYQTPAIQLCKTC